MAGKILFAFGFHNHQPVGNFDFVIEEAYRKAYLPLIETVAQFPNIRVNMHNSGILWDWFESKEPDYIKKVQDLVHCGQLEILSGGYYEPIMSIIPQKTRKWQLHRMNAYIEQRFGQKPGGMWLAERVWEPHLTEDIHDAQLKYIITDDTHFRCAGLSEEQTLGYYLTEEQNKTIAIFPINAYLRYTIPFQEPNVTLEYFKKIRRNDKDVVVVMIDDGEKFGVWPDTYQHVFEKKWLQKFFSMLEDNKDWIRMVTFSDILAQVPPRGRIFLPTASYSEMMEWAMPTEGILHFEAFKNKLVKQGLFEEYKGFVRGGYWRNFLVKYEESNNLHKKMYSVFNYFIKVAENFPFEKHYLLSARDKLLKSQCNCAYWHGIFGGLYLNFLRSALYENMISCEKILDDIFYGTRKWFSIEEEDFLKSGAKQIIVKNREFNSYIDPSRGASLFELDYKPLNFNFMNTMSRYHEAYHEQIKQVLQKPLDSKKKKNSGMIASIHEAMKVKDSSLGQYLYYDSYRKVGFIDHILTSSLSLEQLEKNDLKEEITLHDKQYGFTVYTQDIEFIYPEENPWLIKHFYFTPDESRFQVTWNITPATKGFFACEINLGLMVENAPDRYVLFGEDKKRYPFNVAKELSNIHNIQFYDEYLGYRLDISFSKEAQLIIIPLYTVSLSEAGGERNYQNSTIYIQWPIKKGKSQQMNTTLSIHKSEK